MKSASLLSVLLSFMIVLPALPLRAQVSFFQAPTYSCYGNVFVADFNGDGKPDLLCSDGTVNLGNGDGTFRLGTPVPGTPCCGVDTPLAVADFNGDGKPDILEQDSGALLVLLGNGDGTFQSPITTQISVSFPGLLAVTAVDLNGDGKTDVIGVIPDGNCGSSLLVYLSKGNGTFAAAAAYCLNTLPGALLQSLSVSLGDFNSDDRTDVVVSVESYYLPGPKPPPPAQEIVLLGNGDGTFQTAKSSSSVMYPSPIAVGDFNGDGKLDLVVIGRFTPTDLFDTTYIMLGNGDGTFQAPISVIPGEPEPYVWTDWALAAADVNGDGKLDLIVQVSHSEVQIYLANGDGTFTNSNNYVLSFPIIGGGWMGIVVADLDGDGKFDIAGGGGVLLGHGDGTFQGIPLSVVPNGPAVVGRLDNARTPGMAVLANGGVSILTNNGSGSLSVAHAYPLQMNATIIDTGDFNGDGNLDLIATGTHADTIYSPSLLAYSVLLGNGDGTFQAPVFSSLQAECAPLSCSILTKVADFNNDHKPDLAIASSDGTLFLLLGNGDGTFAAPISSSNTSLNPYPFYPYPLLVGDWNSDGKLDIAGGGVDGSTGAPGTAILLGSGDGTFRPVVFPTNLIGFPPWVAADLNYDGKPDLVSSNQVALGNGDGTFTLLPPLVPPLPYVVNTPVVNPVVADFNGDGKLDLITVTVDDTNGNLQSGILLGNGDGTFGPMINVPPVPLHPSYIVPPSSVLPSFIMVADMNGDGRPDIVFPGTIGYGVLFNTTPAGFELLASKLSPAIVAMGNSATSTVTAIPMFGFNGAVALSCTGLPSGASCAFNPPTIANSSGTSTLTIATTTAIAAGTFPVQVQGSAGAITNSTTLSLVVQAPDFSVGMSSGTPTSQTISAGQTANFNLLITPSGSFTGEVNLSCGITPVVTPAPTCTLSSASVQVSGSSAQPVTVTVGTTASVTTGAVSCTHFPPAAMPLAWMSILLGSAFWMRNRKRLSVLATPVIVLTLALCVSCGGSGSTSSHTTPGTPAGTYTATVTASSGSLSHSTTLQLVVQ